VLVNDSGIKSFLGNKQIVIPQSPSQQILADTIWEGEEYPDDDNVDEEGDLSDLFIRDSLNSFWVVLTKYSVEYIQSAKGSSKRFIQLRVLRI